MERRRKSRQIRIGDVVVGGDAPVVVQSMTNTDTRDVAATVSQIRELEEHDCELVRVAVPDMAAARAIEGIKRAVAAAAYERGVPIRVGVNAGSLPASDNPELSLAQRMVDAAMSQVRLLEGMDFDLIKVSLKAFDVPTTIEAYRDIAARVDYPLHVGITEAGLPRTGVIRSAVGIGILLHEGIGDTIRVSLTAHPREEVIAGYEILKSLDLRQHGPILVSCPSCGRAEVDIIGLAEAVGERLAEVKRPLKVAVMGCIVNGPGEAKDADIGIACGTGRGVLFRKGEQIATVDEADFLEALMAEVEKLVG